MEIELNKIYNMSCIDLMKSIKPKSIDVLLTDPPYGIHFSEKHPTYNRKQQNVLSGYHEVDPDKYEEFTNEWIHGASEVIKDSGTAYIVSGFSNLRHILNALENKGFKIINSLVWKHPFGIYTSKKFVNSHYHILMASKNPKNIKFNPYSRFKKFERGENGKSLNYADRESVWEINRENWQGMIKTATKLPYELIKKMIEYSSDEGDLIFDPFSGSGQTGFVAKDLNRNFIGAEISKNYCDFANKRIINNQYLIPAAS